MFAALTGAGLSAAAGLNAYIPFLIVALTSRFTDLIDLPTQFAWIESNWAIGATAVLLLGEGIFDKIPVVDHINDAVGTFIRPATGGLIFSATQAAEELDANTTFLAENPWIGIVAGVVISGLVHTGKAATRPLINGATLGFGAPVVSAAEDGASLGLSLAAILFPILVIFFLIGMVWGGFKLWRVARDRRNRAETALLAQGYR